MNILTFVLVVEIDVELCNERPSTNNRKLHWIEFRFTMCNKPYYLHLIDQELYSRRDEV